MRLWHYKLIPFLPNSQLLGQWRELNSIFRKQDKHILINYIYEYSINDLWNYSYLVSKELLKRNYNINYGNADSFFYKYYGMKLEGINVRGLVYCYENHHNNRYLKQCFYNLQEKFDRKQKDFDEETYNKLKEFVEKELNKNNPTIIKGEPAKGISKLAKISSYGMIDPDSIYADIYRADVFQGKEKLGTFITNIPHKINQYIKGLKYDEMYDEGKCSIYIYKNEITLSLSEQRKEGINWCKD